MVYKCYGERKRKEKREKLFEGMNSITAMKSAFN